jgi:hypothetical protein
MAILMRADEIRHSLNTCFLVWFAHGAIVVDNNFFPEIMYDREYTQTSLFGMTQFQHLTLDKWGLVYEFRILFVTLLSETRIIDLGGIVRVPNKCHGGCGFGGKKWPCAFSFKYQTCTMLYIQIVLICLCMLMKV